MLRQPDGRLTPIAPGAAVELEVDFVAFAAHGRFAGRLPLDAARLTDWLNAHEEIELEDVRVEELATGRIRIIPKVVLRRDELYVVHITGPRGDLIRRRQTIPRTLTIKVGRYVVTGEIHSEPGLDPIYQLRKRGGVMVPLTDALVTYQGPRGTVEDTVEAVLVNRDKIEAVRRTGVLA